MIGLNWSQTALPLKPSVLSSLLLLPSLSPFFGVGTATCGQHGWQCWNKRDMRIAHQRWGRDGDECHVLVVIWCIGLSWLRNQTFILFKLFIISAEYVACCYCPFFKWNSGPDKLITCVDALVKTGANKSYLILVGSFWPSCCSFPGSSQLLPSCRKQVLCYQLFFQCMYWTPHDLLNRFLNYHIASGSFWIVSMLGDSMWSKQVDRIFQTTLRAAMVKNTDNKGLTSRQIMGSNYPAFSYCGLAWSDIHTLTAVIVENTEIMALLWAVKIDRILLFPPPNPINSICSFF